MTEFRPIALVVGILLTTLGCAMVIPALLDLVEANENWVTFALSSLLTLFVGIGLVLATWGHTSSLNVKQAFLLTVLAWIALAAFAAIPLAISDANISYTDAFFEAMSGLTTTGATVITGLELRPQGILLWRALLQWMGGIGIIVMAIAVLPMLQIGGMQLFRMESSDTSEKILPRATQIAGSISMLYLVFTLACTLGYYFAGMDMFDAVTHAMTTIATGGFANYDSSIGHFQSASIDTIAVIFMLLGSLPFVLYLQVIRGNPSLLTDSQVRFFLVVVVAGVLASWAYQMNGGAEDGLMALRHAAFNVVSIITGTGYATTDYGQWGGFAIAFFFCAMFVGGCAGSTSCGIKIFRFQVILENVRVYLNRVIYPHGVFSPQYNGRPLSDSVIGAVSSFFFMFLLCFGLLALSLNLIGLDNLTALSAAASAMANVGPGLGEVVGPSGNYASLPDVAKWLLCFGMLLGRLELFTVLVLFTPAFWRS